MISENRTNNQRYPSYSVLMSVYAKEQPECLREAIQSILNQTVITNDFVIVCDGPLTPELDNVLEMSSVKDPGRFQILRLENNQGLSNALNVGIRFCKNELVARMDSDDISLPYRCERQLEKFENDPELCLCSGDIAEFETNPDQPQFVRHVPEIHEEIVKYAKKRNPMNHVAVMYKKSAVNAVRGYIEIGLNEDYFLWARMLQKGYRSANINEILVKVRDGNGMYARRGGWRYSQAAVKLQIEFLKMNFISYSEFIRNCFLRVSGSLLPSTIRKYLYQNRLRNTI